MAFHVLALSGGGIRGVHSARIVEMIESQLGGPIARHFDLICGTSVGGILALGLALERPAGELTQFLVERRREIFARPPLRRLLGLVIAKHAAQPLEAQLVRLFGEATMADLPHAVVIPAVDASAGTAVMFKTPHDGRFVVDRHRQIVHVAMATAAAPTYFPVFRAPDARLFVDGGLIANAPGLCGMHEAEIVFKQPVTEIRVLAIGTASIGRNVRSRGGPVWKFVGSIPGLRDLAARSALDMGILRWGSRVFDLTISAQESFTDNLLKHRCGSRYTAIDSEIDTERSRDVERLDAVSDAAIETLMAAAAKTGQEFIGSPAFQDFARHKPAPTRFFRDGPANEVAS